MTSTDRERPTLVIGGTGKTRRRIVDRLEARGRPVRVGSRDAAIRFDWNATTTWSPALAGAGAAHISYHPDLAIPGAVDVVGALAHRVSSR